MSGLETLNPKLLGSGLGFGCSGLWLEADSLGLKAQDANLRPLGASLGYAAILVP